MVVPGLAKASGGPSYSVPALCDELAGLGAQVSLAAMKATGDVNCPAHQDIHLHWISDDGIGMLRSLAPGRLVRALRAVIHDEHARLIHSHGLWTGLNRAAIEAARESRLPFVISPRGMLSPWALGQKAWKKQTALLLYERRNLTEAGALHATSELEARELRELGLRNPIAVIPNGIELPPWREPNNGVEPRTALFLSRIHPKKGLLELVHAWATVQPKGWRCIVAGPDEENHRAAVEAAVRDEELEDAFTFYGPVEGAAKWELYRKADLFVLPTHSENFGLVVAEALACGIPAITTKAAPWELLEQERCGWWTEPTIDGLEAALHTATQLPQAELRAMGLRGRKAVEKRFAWPRVAAEMKQVYQWLCSGGAAPDCVHFYKH